VRPLSEVLHILEEAADAGVFSGAVLQIEDLAGEGSLAVWPVGSVSSNPPGPPVEAGTFFDLASITKLFSVTATLRLVAQGVLALDDSLRQLLEHRSGLPAWQPYFETGDVLATAGRFISTPTWAFSTSWIGSSRRRARASKP